jgi:hypothetical protein
MKIDNDSKQRCRVFFVFLLEAYKVLMGTFLTVFVPHSCGEGDEDCSVVDSFRPQTGYEVLTIVANGVTFLAICGLYLIEMRREHFFIEFFDVDSNYADLHLKNVITPELKTRLLAWNNIYWKAALTSTTLVTSNIALSAVYLSQHFRGSSTITTVLSFSILVLMKLYRSFTMARRDRTDVRARSAYLTEFTSFNVLDPDRTPAASPASVELEL